LLKRDRFVARRFGGIIGAERLKFFSRVKEITILLDVDDDLNAVSVRVNDIARCRYHLCFLASIKVLVSEYVEDSVALWQLLVFQSAAGRS